MGVESVRTAVMHVNSSSMDSTSPTMRIAKFAASQLKCPLIHNRETAKTHASVRFDALLVVYGILKFSDHREEALKIHANAERVIRLENDYTFTAAIDKRFRRPDEIWSTVEGRTRYVNWNMLTRLPIETWRRHLLLQTPTHRGIFYYGAYKEEQRGSDFRKYFDDAPYPVTISSFRGGAKFAASCRGAVTMGAFRDPMAPAAWDMTVYMEDEYSHDLYCSRANRFYECLQVGLPQVIDVLAAPTIRRAGFEVDEFVVSSKRDVERFLKHRDDVIKKQRRLWQRDFGKELQQQFKIAREALR